MYFSCSGMEQELCGYEKCKTGHVCDVMRQNLIELMPILVN